jgi:hypothetical protein
VSAMAGLAANARGAAIAARGAMTRSAFCMVFPLLLVTKPATGRCC